MGFHGITLVSLLIIFLIAILLFGTKRLHIMAKDLLFALKNFNKVLTPEEDTPLSDTKPENLKSDPRE